MRKSDPPNSFSISLNFLSEASPSITNASEDASSLKLLIPFELIANIATKLKITSLDEEIINLR
jgi:hypothetical protein